MRGLARAVGVPARLLPVPVWALRAEDAVRGYGAATGAAVHIFRLPNVFGKWCKPNYNSAVATFCHNIARGLPSRVNDQSTQVKPTRR